MVFKKEIEEYSNQNESKATALVISKYNFECMIEDRVPLLKLKV